MKKFSLLAAAPPYSGPGYDGVDGPWTVLGGGYNVHTNYNGVRQTAVSYSRHQQNSTSMCVGPDGQFWTCHHEVYAEDDQSADNMHLGPFVYRYNGTTWVQVPYSGRADGAISNHSALDFLTYLPNSGTTLSVTPGQICCDGTNVYVLQGDYNYSSPYQAYLKVWKYDGATWTALTTISCGTATYFYLQGAYLTCSSQDVGHPYVAYPTTDYPRNTAYVDRWDGAAWQHVGGTTLPLASKSFSSNNYNFGCDKLGNPYIIQYNSTNGDYLGNSLRMIYYRSGIWTNYPWNQFNLGVSPNYRSTGSPATEIMGNSVASTPVYGTGTYGKLQASFRIYKSNTYPALPLVGQPAGWGQYVTEFNFDTQAWENFLGDPNKGHVYNPAATGGLTGIKKIPNVWYSYGMAVPEATRNLSILMTDIGQRSNPQVIAYDAICAGWRTVNTWAFSPTSDIYVTNEKMAEMTGPFSATGSPISDGQQHSIYRFGTNLYFPIRWHNNKDGMYSKWYPSQLTESSSGNTSLATTGAQNGTGYCAKTVLAYDGANPTVGGAYLAGPLLWIFGVSKFLPMKWIARIQLNGGGGAGTGWCDVSVFSHRVTPNTDTFLGYTRFYVADGNPADNYFIEKEIVPGGFAFTHDINEEITKFRWGVGGGATEARVDWAEVLPLNESDKAITETRVFKGTIHRGRYSCP